MDHNRAQTELRSVPERVVDASHRSVALLVRGDESRETASPRSSDLRELQRRRDPATPPGSLDRGKPVPELSTETLENRVPDDLVSRKGDEVNSGVGSVVDLGRAPDVERPDRYTARDIGLGFLATAYIPSTTSGISARETMRTPCGGSGMGRPPRRDRARPPLRRRFSNRGG